MLRNSFRRALIVSGLLLTVPGMFAKAAFAGDVVVDNPVLQTVSFTSTATAGSPILLTSATALAATSVGNAVVRSNAADGFTVTVTSANSGKLKSGSVEMAYSLNYNGTGVDLSSGSGTGEDPSALITDCADANGCSRPMTIAITAGEVSGKPSGQYSDTLTLSIANK